MARELRRCLTVGRKNRFWLISKSHPGFAVRSLALEVLIAGSSPGQDGVSLVVENEIATVCEDHEHGMPLPLIVDHCRHPHGPLGQSRLDQQPPLQKLDILAVAETIIRIVPPVEYTPMILV